MTEIQRLRVERDATERVWRRRASAFKAEIAALRVRLEALEATAQ